MWSKLGLYGAVMAIVAAAVLALGTAVATAHGDAKALRLVATDTQENFLDLGSPGPSLGDQLVISEGTVKSHVKNICRKLRADNRAEAVSKYLQMVMRERA